MGDYRFTDGGVFVVETTDYYADGCYFQAEAAAGTAVPVFVHHYNQMSGAA